MPLQIHNENPEPRKIQQIVDCLESGGIIIYPTDTVHGLGCDIFNKKAVERICQLRRIDPRKAMLTFICGDIGQIAEYAWQMDNQLFKLLKNNLPGPFTFILKSSNAVPKIFKNNKRTIGVRVPDHQIVQSIVTELGRPMLSISVKNLEAEEDEPTYFSSFWELEDRFEKQVDLIIDDGSIGQIPSALIDCTAENFSILREGKQPLKW